MVSAQGLTLVQRDLAAGHPAAAVRRLRAMLAAAPHDFDLYRLLVEVHRQSGNQTEAGRWGYLTGDASADEVAAFERAHPRPAIQLRLIGWTGDPADLPDDECRRRLADLVSRAQDESTVPIAGRIPLARRGGGRPAAVPLQRPTDRGQAPRQRSRPQRPDDGVTGTAAGGQRAGGQPGGGGQPGSAEATGEPAGRRGGFLRRREPRPGVRPRSFGASLRNFTMLLLFIVFGLGGSVAAVGGVLALFGVRGWMAPIQAILEAIGKAISNM